MHAILKLAFLSAFALSGSSSKAKPDDVNSNAGLEHDRLVQERDSAKSEVDSLRKKSEEIEHSQEKCSSVNAENRKKVQIIFDEISTIWDEKILGEFNPEEEERHNEIYVLLEQLVKNADLYVEAIDLLPELLGTVINRQPFAKNFYSLIEGVAGNKAVEQLKNAFGYREQERFGTEMDAVVNALVTDKEVKKSWRAFAEVAGEILKNRKDTCEAMFQDFFGNFGKFKKGYEEGKEERHIYDMAYANMVRRYEMGVERLRELEVTDRARWSKAIDDLNDEGYALHDQEVRDGLEGLREKKERPKKFKEELMQQTNTFNAMRLLAHAIGDALHAAGIMLVEKARN